MKGSVLMETTLNIDAVVLSKIKSAAEDSGISCSSMISLLLQRVMNERDKPIVIGRLVRYQERRKKRDWHTFHIQLRDDEYEYFLDLRKLRKMSVSLILAYAVKKYLNKNINAETDNNRYQFRNYIISREEISGIPCWILIWGYPPILEQHIQL